MKKIYNLPKFKAIYCKPVEVICGSGNNGHHYGWDDNPDGPDNGRGHHWGNRNNAPFDDIDMENANLMIKLTDEGYVPGEYIKGVRAYIYRKE